MKRLIVYISIVLFFLSCGNKPKVSEYSTRFATIVNNDTIDLTSFYIGDEGIEVSTIKDSIAFTANGKQTTRYKLLAQMGEDFYHLRTPIRKAACSDCHSLKIGGTGIYNKSPGGGEHVGIYNDLYKYWTGKETYIEEDRKPIKNFSTLNSFSIHDAGTILHSSEPSEFPLELQIGKAQVAHQVSDIVLDCRQDPLYNDISMEINGTPLNESILRQSISAFEQTLTTEENRINQYIRGQVNSIKHIEGLVLFNEKKCNSCHNNNTISIARAMNPLRDSVKATRLDANLIDHNGFFHTSEDITLLAAVRRCDSFLEGDNLTYSEARKLTAFIRQNLTDQRYR